MSVDELIATIGKDAKVAARQLRKVGRSQKDEALELMAVKLLEREEQIKRENARDLAAAEDQGLSDAMIDRLTLDTRTIQSMADGLREIATLPDPVGQVTGMWKRPNGLLVGRVRIPSVAPSCAA